MSILTNVSDNTGDYKALILNHCRLGWQFNKIPVINNEEVDVALDLNGKQSWQPPICFSYDGLRLSSNVNRIVKVVVTQHKFEKGWKWVHDNLICRN